MVVMAGSFIAQRTVTVTDLKLPILTSDRHLDEPRLPTLLSFQQRKSDRRRGIASAIHFIMSTLANQQQRTDLRQEASPDVRSSLCQYSIANDVVATHQTAELSGDYQLHQIRNLHLVESKLPTVASLEILTAES
eukprot:scaffold8899_cov21-Prasinocladus_malaysianus.AAC.2